MKVLLIIYLISIIYFLISFVILTAITTRRVRDEGLKFEKMGGAEVIQTVLRIIIFAIFPVFNLIAGSIFLFSDTMKGLVMNRLREKSIS